VRITSPRRSPIVEELAAHAFVAASVEAIDLAAVEPVEASASSRFPHHVVENLGLLAVLALLCRKARIEALVADKDGRSFAGVDYELAVLPGAFRGDTAFVLMPNVSFADLQPPAFQDRACFPQETLGRPKPDVAVIGCGQGQRSNLF
jgi:hypothetical protein